MSFREVNENDILKMWYECIDDSYLCHLTDEEKNMILSLMSLERKF